MSLSLAYRIQCHSVVGFVLLNTQYVSPITVRSTSDTNDRTTSAYQRFVFPRCLVFPPHVRTFFASDNLYLVAWGTIFGNKTRRAFTSTKLVVFKPPEPFSCQFLFEETLTTSFVKSQYCIIPKGKVQRHPFNIIANIKPCVWVFNTQHIKVQSSNVLDILRSRN